MKKYNILRQYLTVVIASFSFVALLSVVIICLWLTQTLAAQETATKGLMLSPLRTELNIAPGTTLDGTLTVTNSTNEPMTVNVSAEEFSVINQQYDYAFTAESNIAKWVTFNPSGVELTVGESKIITYSVGVPLSAEPGGRYISLFVSTNVETSSGDTSSLQRVASLLYITVLGDVTRSGHMLSLTSPWLISDKGVWSVVIQNTGTTHFRSRYNVQTKNMFNDDVVANMSSDVLVLPNTIRLISDTVPLPKLPGIYKVIYTIGLGDTPARIVTKYVLYIPSETLLIIVVIVAIIILVLSRRRKKH